VLLEEKRRSLMFLFISVVFAVLAGALFYGKVKAINNQVGDYVPVLVAKQPIAARTPITPEMFESRLVPRKFAFASFLTDGTQISGHVSLVPLEKGEVVTTAMLKQIPKMSAERMRLVSLTQSERVLFDDVFNALDRVDIVASYQEADRPVTKLLLEDVTVGRVTEDKDRVAAIGVELSVEDAQKLIFMQNFGRQIRVLKHNIAEPVQ
jgi:pilus assembly protein CpaB